MNLQATQPDRGVSEVLLRDFAESGYAILENAIGQIRLGEILAAYDEIMKPSSNSDFRAGSTTNRCHFNDKIVLDDVCHHPVLLAICKQLIGHPIKLRSILGRTVRAYSPAQALHVDVAPDSKDAPIVGFILMLDAFTRTNGATCFIPGSQNWRVIGSDRLQDFNGYREVMACGTAGSMITFDASVWHGHTANRTPLARRSIQGYFGRF